jgi:bifunctional non-homologous end joining protein LigD
MRLMLRLTDITPMLARPCREPFDHANWLFELKHDGFRAIAFIEDGHCRLISRNGYRFGGFRDLEDSIGQALKGRTAILDGEIVCLDGQGRSVFTPLIERQAIPYFYAFDLLWLDGQDWRRRPLLERKATLSRLITRPYGRLLHTDHLPEHGRACTRPRAGGTWKGSWRSGRTAAMSPRGAKAG